MILYRTQGSDEIGFGHIRRSVYLASLIKKKNKIVFLIKKDKIVLNYIESKGFTCITTKNTKDIDWDSVKGLIFDIRNKTKFDDDILVIAKEKKIKTLQITDLGLSHLNVDTIIDGSIGTAIEYKNKKNINYLKGPEFSILHHRFIHFNKTKKKYRKKVNAILLSLGGGVQYRQLRNLIDILYRYNFKLKISGGFYLKKSAKKILKRIYPKIKFVGRTESLARPLYEADIAIITAGTTSYEAACTGTPALYFYYNKEQEFIAEHMEKKNLGIKISDIKNIDQEKLIKTIKALSAKERVLMGNSGKKIFNGKGVYKIIDFLLKDGIIIE